MEEGGLRAVRRIVTVERAEGGAEIASAAAMPAGRAVAAGVTATHLWATAATPVPYEARDDGARLLQGTPPPEGGTRTGFIDFAPGAVAGPMHRTDTLDYAVCVAGEVDLVLPEARETLRPGDVVVQVGASHTWENRGDAPARLMFVMIDAAPKRAGSIGPAARA